jgi:hypothetical protein
MNATIAAALAAAEAELIRLIAQPKAPFAYGVDLYGAEDITADAREIDPESPEAIGQAIVRRWLTDKATLPDDRDYGEYIGRWLNEGTTDTDLLAAGGQLRLEALKDDRVDSLTVEVTLADNSKTIEVTARITPADPRTPDFDLTFGLSTDGAVTVEILRVPQ